MTAKSTPMPMRDAAGSFTIDNPEDGTPIREMFALKRRFLLMTEKCTYELQLADSIDPERTNPDLPHNVRRKLVDYGVAAAPLRKTVLQAKALFRDGFLPIDIHAAQDLAVDALLEFAAMDRLTDEFRKLESTAIERAAEGASQPRSWGIPSVGQTHSHCRTFTQKAHHFNLALLSIARLFLPAAKNWDKLHEIIKIKYGKADVFSKLIAEIAPQLKLVLNLRDALEHNNKGVVVRDFTLEKDGHVAPPTIELNFRTSQLARCSVSSLMTELANVLLIYFEMMVVNLCSKFVQDVGGLPLQVGELPQEFQAAQHVRFGYVAQMPDGRVLPFC
jgi:hypothetical protein